MPAASASAPTFVSPPMSVAINLMRLVSLSARKSSATSLAV